MNTYAGAAGVLTALMCSAHTSLAASLASLAYVSMSTQYPQGRVRCVT